MADIEKIQEEVAQDEQPATITIYQKNGEPYLAPDGKSPCTVNVLGGDSTKVRAAKDAAQRKLLRSRRVKMEPADLRANREEIATAAIVSWHGWTAGDQPFPCTPENARAFVGAEHILAQVEAGIDGHADFFKSS